MQNIKSVLIFGASGFVGHYLAKEFKSSGYVVFGSDRAKEPTNTNLDGFASCDLLDAIRVKQICEEFSPNILVNLAAVSSVGQSWSIPQETMSVNVNGTLNILEAARGMLDTPKILLVGSSEEYSPSLNPLRETDLTDATNPYGISKITQERFAELYEAQYDLKIYRTRSFNHTGVGQASNFVIPSWCSQVAAYERKKQDGILKVGNVSVKRDMCDVRDIVRAYRLLVESDYCGEVFNVGSGSAKSLEDIASIICSYSSYRIKLQVDEDLLRPNDNPYICCDASKINQKIGWSPIYKIEDTLHDMFLEYVKRINAE